MPSPAPFIRPASTWIGVPASGCWMQPAAQPPLFDGIPFDAATEQRN